MAALWALGLAFSLVFWSGIVSASTSGTQGGEGSVLEALLESHYSEWMELVERAQMLHTLEQLVGGPNGNNITIFAPQNHQLQPNIKSYILKPSNAHLLKLVVQHHVLSERLTASDWHNVTVSSLAEDQPVTLSYHQTLGSHVKLSVGEAEVVAPDCIVRADGVVHGVDQMLIPISVQKEYIAVTTEKLATPLPTGAPALDSRRAVLLEKKAEKKEVLEAKFVGSTIAFSPGISPAPSPLYAPAPGPSMGPSGAPRRRYGTKGDSEVTSFITALQNFGGFSEFASILVDLTSLGSEISNLVNEGVKLTILAPDDNAWKVELTHDQLSPTVIEQILHYHIITEYQTEDILYYTLRRSGKFAFSTLRVPLQLVAEEVDGMVVFGDGDEKASILDPDIYADGVISVQGINKVLKPKGMTLGPSPAPLHPVPKTKLMEILELSSRIWRSANEGPRRTVSTFLPAVAALFVFLAAYYVG